MIVVFFYSSDPTFHFFKMVCSCCSSKMSVNISGLQRTNQNCCFYFLTIMLVAISTLGTGVCVWVVFFSPLSATLFPVETPSPALTRNVTAEITLVNATSDAMVGENSMAFHMESLERTTAVPVTKSPLRRNKPAKKNVISDQPIW